MTQKQMMAEIRKLGLTVRVRDGEIRVNLPAAEGGTEGTAYYTTDRKDAVDTARLIADGPRPCGR